MYNDKKILAVIPARGGSKGLPDKNIKKLYNKPLIVWSIEQAKESKYIDRVIVSTDSNEIAKIAVDHGAEVPFIRPSELAKDNTPTIDVLVHLINHLENNGSKYDILLLLEPTSPLRKRGDIDNAMKAFIDNYKNADSVISLGEVHLENPHAIKTIENNYLKPLIDGHKSIIRRQEYQAAYFPYGVVYASKIEKLLSNKTFYSDKSIPYFIERWQNYEVDDIYDFLCIEAIMKKEMENIL